MNKIVETPYTPNLGIRVDGLKLNSNDFAQSIPYIRDLLDTYLVVVIRDQSLCAEALKNFVQHFGPLFNHHADEGVIYADGVPEVLEMRKEPDGERLFGGTDWHADVTFRKPAGYASVLHAVTIPSLGGDTGFASTIAAYDGLSEGMKKMLGGLQAVHSYNGPGRPDHPQETAIHPVIRTHPASGKKGIYMNRMFVTRFKERFKDMSEIESKPLIDFLDAHMSRQEFTFRHRWREGDLVLWDNRFTLHYPINDFTGEARLLIRCTAMEDSEFQISK